MSEAPMRVLFVCLGNICRSPLAEGVFTHLVRARGAEGRFEIDSAGTGGWHAGNRADERMRRVAKARGVPLESRARQVAPEDFRRFDHIICMDESNRENLLSAGAPVERVRLLLTCDPSAPCREVPDPYYGGPEGFETVYELVASACAVLLDELDGIDGRGT